MDLTQKTTGQESEPLREEGASKDTESEITQRLEEKERDRIEGESWACNEDNENTWDCLILSLDGGGIRGYSSLLILEELMKRIADWEHTLNGKDISVEKLLPCHYFDYIWGTSTGGLIAIMLGRLRMSVPQALSLYRDFGETIFGRKQKRALGGYNIFAARYNHRNVEKVIKSTIQNHCKEHQAAVTSCDRDKLQWTDMTRLQVDNNWNICQAVCLTARENGKNCQPFLLRSYAYDHPDSLDHPDTNGGVEELDFLIWEACRATSAAPLYFRHFEKPDKDGKKRRYIDGGVLMNNPSLQALQEVGSRHAVGQKIKKPALLLSVGTGIKDGTPFAGNDGDGSKQNRSTIRQKLALQKHMLMRYTESEVIHRGIRDGFAKGDKRWYKRLSVDEGLGEMKLGDWRAGNWTDEMGGERIRSGGATLTDIEAAVKKYVTRDKLNKKNGTELRLLPKTMIDHTAQRLVRQKTKRENLAKSGCAEDRHRWEKHRGKWLTGEPDSSWEIDTGDEPYVRA